MNTKKIYDSDIENLRVSSLPTRPTAPTAFGGKGYTATEMKAAFDMLPLYIKDSFNALVGDIESGELARYIASQEPFLSLIARINAIEARL